MDEELPKKKPAFQPGQDLSLLSAGELQAAIDMLRSEIARLEAEIASKSASRDAAEAFFRK